MPKEPLSETRMIRAGVEQVERWKAATEQAGYWSVSEWIRDSLDAAAGVGLQGEVVGDLKAICIYIPNRAEDHKPFMMEMARHDTPEKVLKVIFELTERPWCSPPVLLAFLAELKRVRALLAAESKKKRR